MGYCGAAINDDYLYLSARKTHVEKLPQGRIPSMDELCDDFGSSNPFHCVFNYVGQIVRLLLRRRVKKKHFVAVAAALILPSQRL